MKTLTQKEQDNIDQLANLGSLAKDLANYCLGLGVTIEEAEPLFIALAKRYYKTERRSYDIN